MMRLLLLTLRGAFSKSVPSCSYFSSLSEYLFNMTARLPPELVFGVFISSEIGSSCYFDSSFFYDGLFVYRVFEWLNLAMLMLWCCPLFGSKKLKSRPLLSKSQIRSLTGINWVLHNLPLTFMLFLSFKFLDARLRMELYLLILSLRLWSNSLIFPTGISEYPLNGSKDTILSRMNHWS